MTSKLEVPFFALKLDNDIANTCFICGYERKEFEKQERSFQFHLEYEHKIWNYVYYMVYLKYKDEEEFAGIEQYVFNKLKAKRVDWFPIGNSMFLGIQLI